MLTPSKDRCQWGKCMLTVTSARLNLLNLTGNHMGYLVHLILHLLLKFFRLTFDMGIRCVHFGVGTGPT